MCVHSCVCEAALDHRLSLDSLAELCRILHILYQENEAMSQWFLQPDTIRLYNYSIVEVRLEDISTEQVHAHNGLHMG